MEISVVKTKTKTTFLSKSFWTS